MLLQHQPDVVERHRALHQGGCHLELTGHEPRMLPLWPPLSFRPQKAPLPVKEARVLVMPAALGDLMCCGSTSLMLLGETEPFIRLAAISSWLCSLTTIAFFSSSCKSVIPVRRRVTAEVPAMVHPPEIHDLIWNLKRLTCVKMQK